MHTKIQIGHIDGCGCPSAKKKPATFLNFTLHRMKYSRDIKQRVSSAACTFFLLRILFILQKIGLKKQHESRFPKVECNMGCDWNRSYSGAACTAIVLNYFTIIILAITKRDLPITILAITKREILPLSFSGHQTRLPNYHFSDHQTRKFTIIILAIIKRDFPIIILAITKRESLPLSF